MLKRLFLVIFILQSFALNAWAGMDMSQINQAEQTQMKIMHQMMDMTEQHQMNDSTSSMHVDSSDSLTTMMNCVDCNDDTHCKDLVCSSIHASSSLYEPNDPSQASTLIVSNLVASLSISIQYSNSQPETPPPAV